MDLKIGKVHDRVMIDMNYLTLDQKINMINKIYAFTKIDKDMEIEPSKMLHKKVDLYIEKYDKVEEHMITQILPTMSFLNEFNTPSLIPDDILQFINFDDASDDFIKCYLNQISSLNSITITSILTGMLDTLEKRPTLMGTLGNFLRKQYIKNNTEYPKFLKIVHTKINERRLYENINVANKWDEFLKVN